MSTLALLLTQFVNALSQSALLFFLGVGLTLIFGLMRIVNFAHGALYMLGAFVGYSLSNWSGNYWLALAGAPVLVGLLGAAFEFFLLDEPFPVYRLFLAATGIVVAVAIWQFLERSRLGLLIRATSQNADMASALGVDIKLIRSCVFGIGCGLAALGGVLAAPLVTASNGMAATVIIDAFVIVIIGGMGSFLGSLIGALLIGFVQVFGNYYAPDFALAFMYLVMLAVLVVRPGGLLGKEA
jgi:branched-chain amino acid transport system permease protein